MRDTQSQSSLARSGMKIQQAGETLPKLVKALGYWFFTHVGPAIWNPNQIHQASQEIVKCMVKKKITLPNFASILIFARRCCSTRRDRHVVLVASSIIMSIAEWWFRTVQQSCWTWTQVELLLVCRSTCASHCLSGSKSNCTKQIGICRLYGFHSFGDLEVAILMICWRSSTGKLCVGGACCRGRLLCSRLCRTSIRRPLLKSICTWRSWVMVCGWWHPLLIRSEAEVSSCKLWVRRINKICYATVQSTAVYNFSWILKYICLCHQNLSEEVFFSYSYCDVCYKYYIVCLHRAT